MTSTTHTVKQVVMILLVIHPLKRWKVLSRQELKKQGKYGDNLISQVRMNLKIGPPGAGFAWLPSRNSPIHPPCSFCSLVCLFLSSFSLKDPQFSLCCVFFLSPSIRKWSWTNGQYLRLWCLFLFFFLKKKATVAFSLNKSSKSLSKLQYVK